MLVTRDIERATTGLGVQIDVEGLVRGEVSTNLTEFLGIDAVPVHPAAHRVTSLKRTMPLLTGTV